MERSVSSIVPRVVCGEWGREEGNEVGGAV